MNVVLYGDSNTYGYAPINKRYENRYSNIVKRYFNNKLNIYEEGLVGRTTIYTDHRPNRKGIDDIDIILSKYDSIDLFVIMLGTNDLKINNAKNLNDVKNGFKELLTKAFSCNNIKKTLIISPILLSEKIENLDKDFNYNSYLLSKEFSKVYKEIAEETNSLFLDAKEYAKAGIDGEHLDEEGHNSLAQEVIKVIESLWK